MTIKQLVSGLGVAVALSALGVGSSSCRKDFLDLNDPTRLVSSNGYNDSLGIVTGVTAAYSSLQDIYGKSGANRGIFLWGEVPSDNSTTVTSGERLNEFDSFGIVSDNPRLQNMWVYSYQAIARCNIVLGRADGVKLTAATRTRLYAEVRFIRALTYFNLVRIFGDVPLVTTEIVNIQDAYAYGRQPVAAVYQQIEDDLAFAEANLPATQPTANLGRATRGAAQGLLGKVLLTERKYPAAAAKLRQVIDGNLYALQASYANVFLTSNEMNSEILFAVRYSKGGLGVGSPFTNYFLPAVSTAIATTVNGGIGTGQQFNTVDPDLVAAFTTSGTTDVRAAASYGTGGTAASPLYYTRKYNDTPTTAYDAENDWIVLRYADVLLLYAEAVNEAGGPDAPSLSAVNQVIRRSRGLPVATANPAVDLPATTSPATLRTRLETERRLELNFEGHRWFDLVRTGRALDVMNAFFAKYNQATRIDAHNLIWPVPLQETQTNPALSQNPGYL